MNRTKKFTLFTVVAIGFIALAYPLFAVGSMQQLLRMIAAMSPTPTPTPTATPSPTPTPSETPKPYMAGAVYLLNGDHPLADLTGNPALDDPDIAAFRWRENMGDVESAEGVCNWTDIDSGLAIVAAKGKKLTISFACGIFRPQWLHDLTGVVSIGIDTDGDGTDDADMPIPWNTVYRAKWDAFMAAAGAHLDGNASLGQMFFCGDGRQINEFHVCTTTADITAFNNAAHAGGFTDIRGDGSGYKNDAIRQCAKHNADITHAAFPLTPVTFTTGNPWGGDVSGKDDLKDITAYVIGKPQCGLCDSFLHASKPEDQTNTGKVVPYPNGEQAIQVSTRQDIFYANSPPVPYPTPPQPVHDLLQNGFNKGDQYVEIYAPDIQNHANDSTIHTQAAKLISNVPSGH